MNVNLRLVLSISPFFFTSAVPLYGQDAAEGTQQPTQKSWSVWDYVPEAAPLADWAQDNVGSLAHSAGNWLGNKAARVTYGVAGAYYRATGNERGQARVQRFEDEAAADLSTAMGTVADTVGSTATDLFVDPLRLGRASGELQGARDAGHNATWTEVGLTGLTELGRGLGMANYAGKLFRGLANGGAGLAESAGRAQARRATPGEAAEMYAKKEVAKYYPHLGQVVVRPDITRSSMNWANALAHEGTHVLTHRIAKALGVGDWWVHSPVARFADEFLAFSVEMQHFRGKGLFIPTSSGTSFTTGILENILTNRVYLGERLGQFRNMVPSALAPFFGVEFVADLAYVLPRVLDDVASRGLLRSLLGSDALISDPFVLAALRQMLQAAGMIGDSDRTDSEGIAGTEGSQPPHKSGGVFYDTPEGVVIIPFEDEDESTASTESLPATVGSTDDFSGPSATGELAGSSFDSDTTGDLGGFGGGPPQVFGAPAASSEDFGAPTSPPASSVNPNEGLARRDAPPASNLDTTIFRNSSAPVSSTAKTDEGDYLERARQINTDLQEKERLAAAEAARAAAAASARVAAAQAAEAARRTAAAQAARTRTSGNGFSSPSSSSFGRSFFPSGGTARFPSGGTAWSRGNKAIKSLNRAFKSGGGNRGGRGGHGGGGGGRRHH